MTDNHHDTTGMHGMLLAGADPPYLAHLPMFMHPHNYQVILKVTLEDDDVARRIRELHAHGGTDALFTVEPEKFPITELSPAEAEQPRLTTFRGNVVRGHFEHGGETLARGTPITVEDVVHFQELPLHSEVAPARSVLEYLMFGDADRELYLAHSIVAAPDFDHVVVVEISGEHFTEAELLRQLRPTLTVPGRADLPDERLQPGETVAAHTSAGQHFQRDVELHVVRDYYFMADELR